MLYLPDFSDVSARTLYNAQVRIVCHLWYLYRVKYFKMCSFVSLTPVFHSLNVHLGKELSRRDDLESLAYMMVYFMKGTLPWQTIEVAGDIQDLWNAVTETKRITPISVLCEGLPQVFLDFTRYVKKLLFFDAPKYDEWIHQFTELYKKMKYLDVTEFDWSYVLEDEFETK